MNRHLTWALVLMAFVQTDLIAQVSFTTSTIAANTNNVGLDSSIGLTFSVPVTLTVGNNTIIRGSETGILQGEFTGNGTISVTFNPTNDFKPGELITVQFFGSISPHTFSFRAKTSTLTNGVAFDDPFNITSETLDGNYDIYMADMDNDGDLDILNSVGGIGSVFLFSNNNNGTYTKKSIASNLTEPNGISAGDIDGDGDLDIIVATYRGSSGVVWYENDNVNNTFIERSLAIPNTLDVDLVLSDLDGDGDLDAVVAHNQGDLIYWLNNDGSGTFSAPTTIGTGESPEGIDTGDIDGDGDLDVVSANYDGTVTWYENTNGDATSFSSHTLGSTNDVRGENGVALGDIDNDGDLDIVIAAFLGDEVFWYENDGTNTPGFTKIPISSSTIDGANRIALGDLDGDGNLDVLATSKQDDEIVWFKNEGQANSYSFTTKEVIASGAEDPEVVTLGDLDGDGDLDIAYASVEGDRLSIIVVEEKADFSFEVTIPANSTPTFTIPTSNASTYNYNVDWGDGSSSTSQTGDTNHSYTNSTSEDIVYTVVITGTFPAIDFNNVASDDTNDGMITKIVKWGNTNQWDSFIFSGCTNLTIASDSGAPDLSNVLTLSGAFLGCTALNSDGGWENWDVSTVQNMGSMFEGCENFNGNISGWNTSSVTNIASMFDDASAFDQDLRDWDIGSVTNILDIFSTADGMSLANFDATLIGWGTDSSGTSDGIDDIPSNLDFGTLSLEHCLAQDVIADLISTYSWSISSTKADSSSGCVQTSGGGTNADWSTLGVVDESSVFIKNTNVTVDVETDIAQNILVDTNGSLLMNGKGLTITGNFSNEGTATLSDGASIIISGNASGDVTYTRTLSTTNWYLMSVPVKGQNIDAFVTANTSLASGNGNNIGVGFYDTANDNWTYYQSDIGMDRDFEVGEAIAIKLSTANETVSFTGTLGTTDQSSSTIGGSSFNFLGNPFASYVNSGTFLDFNSSSLTSKTIWVWDQAANGGAGAYETKVSSEEFKLAPGQGFFLQSASGAAANVTFEASNQGHETTDTFQRQANANSMTQLFLKLTDGTEFKQMKVYYLDGVTKGFDNGYDGERFSLNLPEGDGPRELTIYSRLLENDQGKEYQIQSLPQDEMESLIVPIGVHARSGKELTFNLETINWTNGLMVFIEDKENNSFTRLDEANSEYNVILNQDLNGIGRFYLHTSSAVLGIDDPEVNTDTIKMYVSDTKNLKVLGIQGKTAQIGIYDILGKQVYNTHFEGASVNDVALPALNSGIYIVRLKTEASTFVKKIIINE